MLLKKEDLTRITEKNHCSRKNAIDEHRVLLYNEHRNVCFTEKMGQHFLNSMRKSVRGARHIKNIQISASILSADMSNLSAVTEGLERAGLDMLHFDVMDGQFVPNISFGIPILEAVDHCTNMFLDVHLMIQNPIQYISQFAKAGADLITFHVESNGDPAKIIDEIHHEGVQAGIVLRPGTPWEVVKPFLKDVEVVLVMTVEPGFGGQSFLWDMVEKVEQLHAFLTANRLPCRIEVDGGINAETAPCIMRAGAEILVIGSYLFRQADPKAAMQWIREKAACMEESTIR